MWVQGAKDLGHPLILSQDNQQGARSELDKFATFREILTWTSYDIDELLVQLDVIHCGHINTQYYVNLFNRDSW